MNGYDSLHTFHNLQMKELIRLAEAELCFSHQAGIHLQRTPLCSQR